MATNLVLAQQIARPSARDLIIVSDVANEYFRQQQFSAMRDLARRAFVN